MPLSSAHVHFNRPLTRMMVEFTPPEYVADRICKRVPVENDSDDFYVMDKSAFNQVNDERADGATENEIDQGWSLDYYRVGYHGLKSKVTDKQRKNNSSGIDLERLAAENIKRNILNRLEQRVFGSGGLLRTAANNVTSANRDWTNASTATPRVHCELGINAVEDACGLTPNTIVLTPKVARTIIGTAEYQAERHFTVDMSTQSGAADLPKYIYGMEAVYVGALLNTAKKGQAASLSRLMSDDVWLGYIAPGEVGDKVMTHSVLIVTEEYARRWRDDEIEADYVAYNFNYAVKKIASECGYLMTSVLTA